MMTDEQKKSLVTLLQQDWAEKVTRIYYSQTENSVVYVKIASTRYKIHPDGQVTITAEMPVTLR
jgi:hypothetical protein